jgi:hypothetical protein
MVGLTDIPPHYEQNVGALGIVAFSLLLRCGALPHIARFSTRLKITTDAQFDERGASVPSAARARAAMAFPAATPSINLPITLGAASLNGWRLDWLFRRHWRCNFTRNSRPEDSVKVQHPIPLCV